MSAQRKPKHWIMNHKQRIKDEAQAMNIPVKFLMQHTLYCGPNLPRDDIFRVLQSVDDKIKSDYDDIEPYQCKEARRNMFVFAANKLALLGFSDYVKMMPLPLIIEINIRWQLGDFDAKINNIFDKRVDEDIQCTSKTRATLIESALKRYNKYLYVYQDQDKTVKYQMRL